MSDARKSYMQPAFLLCVATLTLAAGFKETAIKMLGWQLKKEPIPLRKSFDEIDAARLAPYRVTHKSKIENQDILESLGTDSYIQWELEDTEADASSPVKY